MSVIPLAAHLNVHTGEIMAYSTVERGSPNTLEYRVYFGKEDGDMVRIKLNVDMR